MLQITHYEFFLQANRGSVSLGRDKEIRIDSMLKYSFSTVKKKC